MIRIYKMILLTILKILIILSKVLFVSCDYKGVVQDLHSLRRRALRVPQAEQRMYITRVNQPVMNALTPNIKIRTTALSKKSLTVFYSSRMMTLPAFIPGLKRSVKHSVGVGRAQFIFDV